MLLDKLEEFELANKNLRKLLRETQKKKVRFLFCLFLSDQYKIIFTTYKHISFTLRDYVLYYIWRHFYVMCVLRVLQLNARASIVRKLI